MPLGSGTKCQGTPGYPPGPMPLSGQRDPWALQAAEKLIRGVGRGFYPRHNVHRINAGLQPLRYVSRILGRKLDFFRKLFSHAEMCLFNPVRL